MPSFYYLYVSVKLIDTVHSDQKELVRATAEDTLYKIVLHVDICNICRYKQWREDVANVVLGCFIVRLPSVHVKFTEAWLCVSQLRSGSFQNQICLDLQGKAIMYRQTLEYTNICLVGSLFALGSKHTDGARVEVWGRRLNKIWFCIARHQCLWLLQYLFCYVIVLFIGYFNQNF